MPLPFPPACLPLLLGALPHRSAAQALDVSRRYAGALLAWPQLPQRSFREQHLVQSVIGFPGLVIDAAASRVYVDRNEAEQRIDELSLAYLEHAINYAALSADDAAGLAELMRVGGGRQLLAVKGQILGPISAAIQLTDQREHPLIYDDMLFDALTQILRLRVAWQELRLSEVAPTTIICVDEPLLEATSLPFFPHDPDRVYDQIDEVLAGISGCRAVYTCGAVDLERLMQTSVELLIADMAACRQNFASSGEALAKFLERGGLIGLGVVPAGEEQLEHATVDMVCGELEAFLAHLEMLGVPRDRLVQQALITPAGSLGRLRVASAERALQLVADVSRRVRETYALT